MGLKKFLNRVGSVGRGLLGVGTLGLSESLYYQPRKAAKDQEESIEAAQAQQATQYDQSQRELEPFKQSAYRILPLQEDQYKRSFEDLNKMREYAYNPESSPWFKLQMDEVINNLNKQLAARGLYNSGAGLELIRKGTEDIAAREAANKYTNLASVINAGQGLSPMGYNTSAIAQGLNLGSNYGDNMANLMLAGGQNRAGLHANYANAIKDLWGLGAKVAGMGGGLFSGIGDLGSSILQAPGMNIGEG
jgi:hypothetical protein